MRTSALSWAFCSSCPSSPSSPPELLLRRRAFCSWPPVTCISRRDMAAAPVLHALRRWRPRTARAALGPDVYLFIQLLRATLVFMPLVHHICGSG